MFRNLCDISKSLDQLSTTSMSSFFFEKDMFSQSLNNLKSNIEILIVKLSKIRNDGLTCK